MLLKVHNDKGELINLLLENVLYVPELARRLFSLMSLIEQDHEVMMPLRNMENKYYLQVNPPRSPY